MIYTQNQINLEICRRLSINLHGKTSGNVMTDHLGRHGTKSPCFSINLDDSVFYCFSCGEKGTLRSLYFNETGHGILGDMGLRKDDVYYESRNEIPDIDFNDAPEVEFEFNGKTVPCESVQHGKDFLKFRGFDKKTSFEYGMKFVISGITRNKNDPNNKDYHVNFKNRVIIPIYENRKLISLEGRDCLGEEHWKQDLIKDGKNPEDYSYKKVLFPKLSSVNTLYGFDNLDTSETLYIVEGLMDLIALRTSKIFKNSSCYFGAQITQRQFFLLNKFKDIVVIPNFDEAGLLTVKKILSNELKTRTKVLWPPCGYGDVNEILQKPGNVKSIDDAVNRNWLSKMTDIIDVDIDGYEKMFKENKK
jgi:DNA primase